VDEKPNDEGNHWWENKGVKNRGLKQKNPNDVEAREKEAATCPRCSQGGEVSTILQKEQWGVVSKRTPFTTQG